MTLPPAAAPSHVLITGASGGLGAAFARVYAAPGRHLSLVARDRAKLEEVAAACQALGAQTSLIPCDVRDAAALQSAIATADAARPVDLVVANAGIEASIGRDGSPEPLDTVLAQIETNLSGALTAVSAVLPAMQARRRGAIILISSLAALEPLADQPTYCATKAGLLTWGDAARPWLKAFGIQVSVACPGFIATGMSAHYRGWRPFQWSADKTARHIATAAAKGRARISFPLPLVALIALGKLAPRPLREWVRGRLFSVDVS